MLSSENNHIAEPVRSKLPECQLHKWVLGGGNPMCRFHTKVKSQLRVCLTCNIVLCIKCYKIFHTVYDLKTTKLNIQRAYNEEINNPDTNETRIKKLLNDLTPFNTT